GFKRLRTLCQCAQREPESHCKGDTALEHRSLQGEKEYDTRWLWERVVSSLVSPAVAGGRLDPAATARDPKRRRNWFVATGQDFSENSQTARGCFVQNAKRPEHRNVSPRGPPDVLRNRPGSA